MENHEEVPVWTTFGEDRKKFIKGLSGVEKGEEVVNAICKSIKSWKVPKQVNVVKAIESALLELNSIDDENCQAMDCEKFAGKGSTLIEIRPTGKKNKERIFAQVVWTESGPQLQFESAGVHSDR